MEISVIKLTDLHEPKRNVRMHGERQLNEFRRSVEMFGQIRPIVVDENHTILAGNGLYKTLVSMGKETAECYVVHNLTETQKKKLMLADNKIFSLGADDMAIFEDIICEIGSDFDFDIPGYDAELIKTLSATAEQVDDMIESNYGILEPNVKKNILKNVADAQQEEREQGQQEAVKTAQAGTTPAPAKAETRIYKDTDHRQVVICPHCGEKIYIAE